MTAEDNGAVDELLRRWRLGTVDAREFIDEASRLSRSSSAEAFDRSVYSSRVERLLFFSDDRQSAIRRTIRVLVGVGAVVVAASYLLFAAGVVRANGFVALKTALVAILPAVSYLVGAILVSRQDD